LQLAKYLQLQLHPEHINSNSTSSVTHQRQEINKIVIYNNY